MDRLKRRWHRYHYKNLTYLSVSIVIGIILLKNPTFREMLFHMGNLGYIGAFAAGLMSVSTFTVSIAAILLMLLAETLHPLEIGIIAGIGSVLGDLTIFHFIRNRGLSSEIRHIFQYFAGDKLHHIVHTKYFSWTLPVLGALIIASPLPDELGVSLMGISKMKTLQFTLLSFTLNTIGIILFVSAGAILRP